LDLGDINNVSVFSPYVGQRFEIAIDEDQVVSAELVEVEALDTGPGKSGLTQREPFSLLFAIEGDANLPQQMYQVHHEALGELPLFLVPVSPGRMETVFN
jgi:hypothetical protein